MDLTVLTKQIIKESFPELRGREIRAGISNSLPNSRGGCNS